MVSHSDGIDTPTARHFNIPHKRVDEISIDCVDVSTETICDLTCWCCLEEAHWRTEDSLCHAVVQRLRRGNTAHDGADYALSATKDTHYNTDCCIDAKVLACLIVASIGVIQITPVFDP